MGKQVDISPLNELTRDRETSIRLYYNYREKYPDQSPEWVVEKCASDLLRDRGVAANPKKPLKAPEKKSLNLDFESIIQYTIILLAAYQLVVTSLRAIEIFPNQVPANQGPSNGTHEPHR